MMKAEALPKEPPFGSGWRWRAPTPIIYIALCKGKRPPWSDGAQEWLFLAVSDYDGRPVTNPVTKLNWGCEGWEPA